MRPQTPEASASAADIDEIYVREDGPGEAPTLVLIHGTAASLRSWDAMVPLLTETHRVIRIDLLGCGRSPAPDAASYAVPDQARRVAAALDRRGIGRAIVVGHSSGGLVATALAEQRPDLVTALTLINTGPHMGAYTAADLRIAAGQWPDLTDEQLRQVMSPAFAAGYEIPQEVVDEARGMNLRVFAATSQAVRDFLEEQTVPQRLVALGKPLLVIFGEDDQRWRSSSAAEYRVVPDTEIEMLPGVGHSPILEDPQRTAGPILAFTRRVG